MIFVPHRTVICEHVLEEQGLHLPNLSLYDYKLDLVPFGETDLCSSTSLGPWSHVPGWLSEG